MLKYPCLVLDHDDTVVQSEATVNYPFFVEFSYEIGLKSVKLLTYYCLYLFVYNNLHKNIMSHHNNIILSCDSRD